MRKAYAISSEIEGESSPNLCRRSGASDDFHPL